MEKQLDTLLYFGSFNPIHLGHISLAENILRANPGYELWMIVSPHNPLKEAAHLAPQQDRLRMAQLAVSVSELQDRISVSDIEFSLPKPSATITTLRALTRRYPDRRFTLLIGSDNVAGFTRWIDYRDILDHYPVWVYPRAGFDLNPAPIDPAFLLLKDLPLLPQMATDIRQRILRKEAFDQQLPDGVGGYIRRNKLYGYTPDTPEHTASNAAFPPLEEIGIEPEEASIEALSAAIARHPDHPGLYLQRGNCFRRNGALDLALNDFLQVCRLEPHNTQAQEYCRMLREIFNRRYTELYNP